MTLLKSMWKSVMLMSVAGVLMFAGGAFAQVTAISAGNQSVAVTYGTVTDVTYALTATGGTETATDGGSEVWTSGALLPVTLTVNTATGVTLTGSGDAQKILVGGTSTAATLTALKISTSATTPGGTHTIGVSIGAVTFNVTLTIGKATPTVTFPEMVGGNFDKNKTTLAGYDPMTSANCVEGATGSVKLGETPVTGGTFAWVAPTTPVVVVSQTSTAKQLYPMKWTPPVNDDGSANTNLNAVEQVTGTGVALVIKQVELAASNVTPPTFPDYTGDGSPGAGHAAALYFNDANRSLTFNWATDAATQGAGTLTLETRYRGSSDFGTALSTSGDGWTSTAPKNAGTYEVGVRVNATSGNYQQNTVTNGAWKIVILPKPVKITSASHTKVYDATVNIDDASKVTATISNGGSGTNNDYKIMGTGTVKVTVTDAVYTNAAAGTKSIDIKAATLPETQAGSNYEILHPDGGGTKTTITELKGTGTQGITQKPIKIAATGHVLDSKTFNGDSLIGAQGTATEILFDGLEGTDAFAFNTDYTLEGAAYDNSNAGEDKPVAKGRLHLKGIETGATSISKNYKFANANDSALANKGITGTILQKTMTSAMVVPSTGVNIPVKGIPYTGSEIVLTTSGTKPQLKVEDTRTFGTSTKQVNIIKATDYVISYEDNINAGTAKVIVTPTETGNYKADDPAPSQTFLIAPKAITIAKSGHVVEDRFYDGTVVAPVTKIKFDGLAPNDELSLLSEDNPEGDYSVTGAIYASPNASEQAKAVSYGVVALNSSSDLAKNYTLGAANANPVLTANIGSTHKVSGMVYKKQLVITAVETGGERTYNGSDSVNVTSVTFASLENPDDVETIPMSKTAGYTVVGAKYADANAGTEKQIAEGTVVLKGTTGTSTAYATNFEIPDPNLAGYGNDVILQRELTISTSASKIYKPYDGSATISKDDITLVFTAASGTTGLLAADKDKEGFNILDAAFEDEVIGKNKNPVSGTVELIGDLATNYFLSDASLTSLKGEIGKQKIPFRGVSHTKVYDGNVTATGVQFVLDPADYTMWDGDVYDWLPNVTWSYTNKNAGTKTLKPAGVTAFKSGAPKALTDFYTLSGDVVEMDDGGITKKPLAINTITHSKAYDGTTAAKITNITWKSSNSPDGLASADKAADVKVDSVEANYTSAVPGTKTVQLTSVALTGAAGGNYEVIIPDTAIEVGGTPAGIVPAPVTIAGVVITKEYDGSAEVGSELVTVKFNGIAVTDTPFVDYLVTGVKLADAKAGTPKAISAGTVVLTGAATENYAFSATAGDLKGKTFPTVSVTQKKLTLIAAEHTKAYDGGTAAKNVKVTFDPSELLEADSNVTIETVDAQYTSSLPGTKTLKINKVTFKGGNYTADTVTLTVAEGITGTFVDSITVKSANDVDTISGRRTLAFSATVFPTNASVKAVKWSVSDTSIASINATSGLLTSKRNGTVEVTAAATDGTDKKGTFKLTIIGVVSVAEVEREIPVANVVAEAAVAPVKVATAAFTAGPSPVSKNGKIKFFSANQVKSGSLYIFDATGKSVAKVGVKAGIGEIGSWSVGNAAEGSYIVKGVLAGKDGTREKVSFVFSVVK